MSPEDFRSKLRRLRREEDSSPEKSRGPDADKEAEEREGKKRKEPPKLDDSQAAVFKTRDNLTNYSPLHTIRFY